MKKIIIIIIIFSLGYFVYDNFISGHNILIITSGNEIVLNSGDNTFTAKIVSDYNEKLRIYGVTNNDSEGWSPIAYANYIFVASPFIGDTDSCEANSASQAPILNIVVEDEELIDKINNLKMVDGRRRATIIGEKLYITKFTFKGDDHTDALTKQGRMDPRDAIFIREIVL